MTYCPNCGTGNQPASGYCEKCGQPLPVTAAAGAVAAAPAPARVAPPKTNSLAVASLCLGIFSLFPLFGILAVVFGHIARSQIRKSQGRQKGGGLALAGLILGYLGLAFILFVIFVVIPSLSWH